MKPEGTSSLTGYTSSEEETMPDLEPGSDDEEENNSSEGGDDDEDSASDGEDSGPEEKENIPDLVPENEEEAADKIAKAIKAHLNQGKEGKPRYTDLDISAVQGGDPMDPVNYPMQRSNGRERGYMYIQVCFEQMPHDVEARRTMNKGYLPDHKSAYDPAYFIDICADGLMRIFKSSVFSPSTRFLPYLPQIQDPTNIQWRQQILNDDRLRQSVMASEKGTTPTYTSTYLEAIKDGSTWKSVSRSRQAM
jgi:hypothetical protein